MSAGILMYVPVRVGTITCAVPSQLPTAPVGDELLARRSNSCWRKHRRNEEPTRSRLLMEGVLRVYPDPGRAAKRMPEATGFEAKTIHRLLEADPKGGGFTRHSDTPLACARLVVDEPSMVDVRRMPALRRAIPERAARLIVGDIDQLPSGGPGQVLADSIASGAVPVVRLTEVFRQAAQRGSRTSAHRINQGSMPDLSRPEGDRDFYFVSADDPETAVPRIIELVKTRIPQRFPGSAAKRYQATTFGVILLASASSWETPWPFPSMTPRLNCASGATTGHACEIHPIVDTRKRSEKRRLKGMVWVKSRDLPSCSPDPVSR